MHARARDRKDLLLLSLFVSVLLPRGGHETRLVCVCVCVFVRVCVKSAPGAFLGKERKKEEKSKIKIRENDEPKVRTSSEKKAKKKNWGNLFFFSSLNQERENHVETKRFDVRGKSARQQQPNENGVGRAEERDGCVFLFL
jgi:hypothetical protein